MDTDPHPPPGPGPGPVDAPGHWAVDPVRRRLFAVLGPVVVFLAGLPVVLLGMTDLRSFLIAYPVMAAALVYALMSVGELAAEAQARGEPLGALPPRIGAAIAVAALALPLVSVSEVDVGDFGLHLLGPVFAMGLVMALLWVPKGTNPLWIVVPMSVLAGAAGAAMVGLFQAIFSIWGGDPASHAELIGAWIVCAGAAYAGLGARAGHFSGNPLTPDAWRKGVGWVAFCSAVLYTLLARLLDR